MKKYKIKITILHFSKHSGMVDSKITVLGELETELNEHDLSAHLFALEFKGNGSSSQIELPTQRIHIELLDKL